MSETVNSYKDGNTVKTPTSTLVEATTVLSYKNGERVATPTTSDNSSIDIPIKSIINLKNTTTTIALTNTSINVNFTGFSDAIEGTAFSWSPTAPRDVVVNKTTKLNMLFAINVSKLQGGSDGTIQIKLFINNVNSQNRIRQAAVSPIDDPVIVVFNAIGIRVNAGDVLRLQIADIGSGSLSLITTTDHVAMLLTVVES